MSNIDRLAYNRAGQLFWAANTASVNIIAPNTTMTGFILYNPMGSGKTAYLIDVGVVWVTVPGAVHNICHSIAPASATVPTTVTAVGSGVISGLTGAAASGQAVQAYLAATIPTATVRFGWFAGGAYASAVGENPYSIVDRVDGAIAIQPGCIYAVSVVTTTVAGMASASWIEIANT